LARAATALSIRLFMRSSSHGKQDILTGRQRVLSRILLVYRRVLVSIVSFLPLGIASRAFTRTKSVTPRPQRPRISASAAATFSML
jgi:hypothetical protein